MPGDFFFLFFVPAVKTHPMMIPQRFILMAKLLIYQLRFQSAVRCAKTGPRKENPFVSVEGWRGCRNFSNLRPDFIREGVRLAKTMKQPTKQNNLKRKQKIGDERLRKRCLFFFFFFFYQRASVKTTAARLVFTSTSGAPPALLPACQTSGMAG